MSVQTMEVIIADYVAAIGKHPEELKEVRIVDAPDKPTGPIAWDIELVFGNQWITYTRVARFWLNEGIHFKSITQKTRLHVPVSEVPEGARFFRGEKGPYLKSTQEDGSIMGRHYAGLCGWDIELAPWSVVECEFYHAKGEGAMAGGRLWVREADLLERFGQEGLADLVGGCKFTYWATCHKMATGRRSKFS